jgi:tripartite-type tricarboxylate transporter receptor subunit TctC
MIVRRRVLAAAAGAFALPGILRVARAQTFPGRPVRLIVGFAAGGTADIVARLIAQSLSERLGQSFVVENRPGAGSNLAAEAVAKAPPDGHTLLFATAANAVNTTLYDKLGFSFAGDLVPIATVSLTPFVMEVNASLPVKTVPEFIAYAKDNPGKINMASGGIGTGPHLSGELFKMLTGIAITHVTYRGTGPAIADLLGGQLQVMFDNLPSSIEYIRDGRLRALAVTTSSRSPALPDTPALAEFLPGYDASSWNGICAPARTSPEIVRTLNREANAALADQNLRARLASLGAAVLSGSPTEFAHLIADETEKWGKVVKFSQAKAQ